MKKAIPVEAQFLCGLDATLRVVSGKWKPLILFFLAKGTMRYGELHRCVRGVSYKVLTQQLKDLENHGVISRVDYGEIPPRVDYSLTPLGVSLAAAMVPLCDWGTDNMPVIAAALERANHQ